MSQWKMLAWLLATSVSLDGHACAAHHASEGSGTLRTPAGRASPIHRSFADRVIHVEPNARNVLILGSGGLIGSAVVRELQQAGHTVHEVRHRYDVDLRVPGALDRFNNASIDFAFFLAYEAGTPKDWDIPGNGKRIVTGNTRMYDAVLPYLAGRRIPYLFPSSGYAALNATEFHRLKLDGEARVLAANSSGKVVKLWDVYGYRKGAMHSQELAEWMHQCASGEAEIRATCSSNSRTQLAHVDDIARALVDVMVSFDRLAPVTDVSTGVWLSNRQVAAALARASGGACHVHFHRKQDVKREMNPANLWRVHHDFPETGLGMADVMHTLRAGWRMDQLMRLALADLFITVQADAFVGTLSSNWARLTDELRRANGKARVPYATPEGFLQAAGGGAKYACVAV